MKLAEIKVDALRLMLINYEDDLIADRLSEYMTQENYKHYLVNMPQAINRAIDRINSSNVLGTSSYEVSSEYKGQGFTSTDIYSTYDLNAIIPDYQTLHEVIRTGPYGMEGNVDAISVGNAKFLLPPLNSGEAYIFVYRPKVKIDVITDEDEVPLPDELARIIPYWVKGEVYQDDEPNIAADAKNQFEQFLIAYARENTNRQSSVESVYRAGA